VGLEQQQVHSEIARIAGAIAASPVYAAETRRDSVEANSDAQSEAVHPVLLTRLFLLFAGVLVLIVLAAQRSWLLVPVALLPLAMLGWLASRCAASRSASWVVLALSVLVVGPVILALLANLS